MCDSLALVSLYHSQPVINLNTISASPLSLRPLETTWKGKYQSTDRLINRKGKGKLAKKGRDLQMKVHMNTKTRKIDSQIKSLSENKPIICAFGNLHYQISREKFEPELGFEPQTSGF